MKIKVLGLLLMVFVVSSCSTMKKIDFETLETSEFVLTSVSFYANGVGDLSLSSEDVKTIMTQLPVADIVQEVEVKYGVQVDTSFFENKELFSSSIKFAEIKGENGEIYHLPNFISSFDTPAKQTMDISFSRTLNSDMMNVDVSLRIYDEVGTKINETSFYKSIDETFLSIPVVDRQNLAELVLSKSISNASNVGIYKLSVYRNINGDGDRTIYLEGDKEYTLHCIVEDPGVFMIVDPATFYKTWIGTLESGKRYELDYKINRPFLRDNWNIEWVLTELE